MKNSELSNWINIRFIVLTFAIALTLIILGPIDSLMGLSDLTSIYTIIIPVLIGQIAALYQWRTNGNISKEVLEKEIDIPAIWFKLPFYLSSLSIFIGVILRIFSVQFEWDWQLSEDQFKKIVSFSMVLINATLIISITNIFKTESK